ncbi:unnamed protein product [Caenorhabditis angaria]|uniref:Uncharacterized protein n=1 Tax=Caenorhabditis angaria TaxID=860376 RepID=A0A9P1INN9_9PELO|nr:unnamed protein product [Caenorhabditis angaria]
MLPIIAIIFALTLVSAQQQNVAANGKVAVDIVSTILKGVETILKAAGNISPPPALPTLPTLFKLQHDEAGKK